MDAIDLFLKALEETFANKRGTYVLRRLSTPCKFPAYKQTILEVWCVDGDNELLISKVEATRKNTNPEEQQELDNFLYVESVKNILKYYGL